jgi:hypothetical protein
VILGGLGKYIAILSCKKIFEQKNVTPHVTTAFYTRRRIPCRKRQRGFCNIVKSGEVGLGPGPCTTSLTGLTRKAPFFCLDLTTDILY